MYLLNRLDEIFADNEQQEKEHISQLQLVKSKINQVSKEYDTNLNSCKPTIEDINKRSKKNCEMIKQLLETYESKIKQSEDDLKSQVSYECELMLFDTEIKHVIDTFTDFGHILHITPMDTTTTIIDSDFCKQGVRSSYNTVELESNVIHKFGTLKVPGFQHITVSGWNEKTDAGGKLIIHCYSLILEGKSSIDVSGKGYKGGKILADICYQGYSYNGTPKCSKSNNYGGGGCGSAGGRGNYGGYRDCEFVLFPSTGANGERYGDEELSTVHLGSGGGAVIIFCKKDIIIHKKASILADGEMIYQTSAIDKKKHCVHGGGGSGGSIYLKAPNITNRGTIRAAGGRCYREDDYNCILTGYGGRIRLESLSANKGRVWSVNITLSTTHNRDGNTWYITPSIYFKCLEL